VEFSSVEFAMERVAKSQAWPPPPPAIKNSGSFQGPPDTPPIPRKRSGVFVNPARAMENKGMVEGRTEKGEERDVPAP